MGNGDVGNGEDGTIGLIIDLWKGGRNIWTMIIREERNGIVARRIDSNNRIWKKFALCLVIFTDTFYLEKNNEKEKLFF